LRKRTSPKSQGGNVKRIWRMPCSVEAHWVKFTSPVPGIGSRSIVHMEIQPFKLRLSPSFCNFTVDFRNDVMNHETTIGWRSVRQKFHGQESSETEKERNLPPVGRDPKLRNGQSYTSLREKWRIMRLAYLN
jgi:hypothetical protein